MPGVPTDIRVNSAAVARCEAKWSWHPPAENFTDFDFWLVWAGRGELRCEDESVPVRAGCAFCLRPRLHYHATHDPNDRLGIGFVHFDYVDPSGRVVHPKEAGLPPLTGRLTKVQFYESVLRHIAELVRSGQGESRSRAADYLKLVLDDYRRESSSEAPPGLELEHSERIERVMRYIRENPGRILAVSELSRLACYSPDHFARVFTRVAGAAPKEFCIRARMERAKQLLRESRMSIDQVASSLGYADMFFFSRQFKQRFGASPRKWRQEGGSWDGRR
jgi:AraC-like DNA-binding protein